ncbi:MAG: ParA family protein [Nitrosomonas sp.]|nr:ParA family protein [Nitrosomonas sp.]
MIQSFLIANPKGGCGKTTLSTNLAGYFARQGHGVMLGDIDRQQSAHEWLRLRPKELPLVHSWDIQPGEPVSPPKGAKYNADRVVLDSPAGLRGKKLEAAIKRIHHVIVPLQPSIFDMLATRAFLDVLLAEKAVRKQQTFIAVVGMRVDPRTRAAVELARFVEALDVPVLGFLRNTQRYVQLAAQGMTLFDLSPARAGKDLQQWQGIIDWINTTQK